jgi:gluconolactonase
VTPSAEHLGTIEFPEEPANVAFGGEDYKTLFVTAVTSLYSIRLTIAGTRPY